MMLRKCFAICGGIYPQVEPKLKGYSRLRTIINYFTRMRLVDDEGNMDLKQKHLTQSSYKRGFNNIRFYKILILKLFSHWRAFKGATNLQNIIGLDTDCVWGGTLSAMRLEDHKIFQVESLKIYQVGKPSEMSIWVLPLKIKIGW